MGFFSLSRDLISLFHFIFIFTIIVHFLVSFLFSLLLCCINCPSMNALRFLIFFNLKFYFIYSTLLYFYTWILFTGWHILNNYTFIIAPVIKIGIYCFINLTIALWGRGHDSMIYRLSESCGNYNIFATLLD